MRARTKAFQMSALVAALLLTTAAGSFAQQRTEDIRHIDAAMQALNTAAKELQAAGKGFGTHRGKAQELVKQAQEELRQARKYAQEHPNK